MLVCASYVCAGRRARAPFSHLPNFRVDVFLYAWIFERCCFGSRHVVLLFFLDVRPSDWWVRQLLRGMRLSFKKPGKFLKELHSPEQQHANTHRLFIKLCWLVETHAVTADRIVNIDETSCRLLPVDQTGRETGPAARQHKEATTFTIAFSMDRGPLYMLVEIVHAGKTDAVLPEQPRARSSRHVRERLGNHSRRRAEPRQGGAVVDPFLGHGEYPRQ